MNKIHKLPDDAAKIINSEDYVDTKGNIYSYDNRAGHRRELFIREQIISNGYKYCNVRYFINGKYKNITKRVNRIVADAFLPNPNNLPIVMHKNNNKLDNRLENLKWGTISENTKDAFKDGLSKNSKGSDDSQSIACDCYNTIDNKLIASYGSCSEAAIATGISKSTILNQLRNPSEKLRKNIYFVKKNSGPIKHLIVVEYDYDSDLEIARYINIGVASKKTGIADSTILEHTYKGKPKNKFLKTYFKRIYID